jgi:hypothetical protein
MYGGVINSIDDANLIAQRDPALYTDDERSFINLLRIKHDANIKPIGSFTLKVQKYPSDIDINQVVVIKKHNFKTFVNDLKSIVRNILKRPLVYYSDFKAGVDSRYPDDKDKFVLRWSPKEVLKGYKTLPGDVKMTLEESVSMKGILKMDIIVYSNGRFIEESTFFILEDENGSYINVPQDFYSVFIDALKKDIYKYSQHGKNFKLFKAVKRMWSLARLNRDYNMLRTLKPFIVSNLSLLGQISADLETIELLEEKTNKWPTKEINNAINLFAKNLSTVADMNLDQDMIISLINTLKSCNGKKCNGKFNKALEEFHDYLLEVINSNTLQYMKGIKLYPIPLNYINREMKGGCTNSESPTCPKNIQNKILERLYKYISKK